MQWNRKTLRRVLSKFYPRKHKKQPILNPIRYLRRLPEVLILWKKGKLPKALTYQAMRKFPKRTLMRLMSRQKMTPRRRKIRKLKKIPLKLSPS